MTVFVNNKPFDLLPGMTVKHALIAAGLHAELETVKIRDDWGNEMGLDGALTEGMRIHFQ